MQDRESTTPPMAPQNNTQTKDKTKQSSPALFKTIAEGEAWDIDLMIKYYKKKYESEQWYTLPTKKDGNLELSFPDKTTAMEFAEEVAKNNGAFIMVNAKTGEVVAYANGDGILNKNEGGKSLDEIKEEMKSNTPGLK